MSMFSQFKTDAELETNGIELDYGEYAVRIARAGGANKTYQKTMERETKPYRRAIETGVLPNERMTDILMKVFAEAVVLDWQVGEEGRRKRGIETEDGKIVEPTPAAVHAVFKALPDLFWDIHEQANKIALFRRVALENEAKN